ncbi:rhomboid family intramembrane serine protease [Nonlabens ponticola]|nr:rhomboid family intramembrane serine protease [Nonlabens ponticola]
MPRAFSGLIGIVCSPFLHADLNHLWSNTPPILLLGIALFYFFRYEAGRIFMLAVLLSGFMTWLIGRESYHIGASGLIYFLASFLISKGVIKKSKELVALSFAVVFFYGSLVWYVFPIDNAISWEGHLAGAIAGIILAMVINTTDLEVKAKIPKTIRGTEQEDWFLQQFDENGDFAPFLIDEEE